MEHLLEQFKQAKKDMINAAMAFANCMQSVVEQVEQIQSAMGKLEGVNIKHQSPERREKMHRVLSLNGIPIYYAGDKEDHAVYFQMRKLDGPISMPYVIKVKYNLSGNLEFRKATWESEEQETTQKTQDEMEQKIRFAFLRGYGISPYYEDNVMHPATHISTETDPHEPSLLKIFVTYKDRGYRDFVRTTIDGLDL